MLGCSAQTICSKSGLDVSPKTARRIMKEAVGTYRRRKKKQAITESAAIQRLNFAELRVREDFSHWVFSDECAIRLDDCAPNGYCWMSDDDIWKPEFLQQTRHSGGGMLMIWGCITQFGVGPLVFFNGTVDSQLYLDLLRKTVKPFLTQLNRQGWKEWVFMDDNAPIHRATIVKNWIAKEGIDNPEWPPYSPDLNPIENIWAFIKAKLRKVDRKITKIDDLKVEVDKIWHSLSQEFIWTYICSMNRRLHACLKSKGYHTKY